MEFYQIEVIWYFKKEREIVFAISSFLSGKVRQAIQGIISVWKPIGCRSHKVLIVCHLPFSIPSATLVLS